MLWFGAEWNNDPDIDPELKAAMINHLWPGTTLDVVIKDALILRYGSTMLRKWTNENQANGTEDEQDGSCKN